MDSISVFFSLISSSISLIFDSSDVMESVVSSIARAILTASLVSFARLASHSSFFFKSSSSSLPKSLIISLMALSTSVKWLLLASPRRRAKTESREFPACSAAARRVSAALLAARRAALRELAEAERPSWRKKKPCDARDFLKRSRASSSWRMLIAFVTAAISSARKDCLSFHSFDFSFMDFSTCSMYSSSFLICAFKSSLSSLDSSLAWPRAPVSFSMEFSAPCAALSSLFLASIDLS
mmetsp:Transcript_83005/g.216362  ORF Transcript_83005/g.216362 Transcript_83005/m.216362 type:complete len:239 (-) Transcript_83005:918-1634(-)